MPLSVVVSDKISHEVAMPTIEESKKSIEDGLAKAANSLRAALPSPDEAARELQRLDNHFEKIRARVRSSLEQGTRRTDRRPL